MISLLYEIILSYLIAISFLEYEAADSPPNSDKITSNEKPGENKPTPRIQIRAILVRCPKKDDNDFFKGVKSVTKNISSVRSEDILQFGGYDKDELLINSEVKDCRSKLFITMKLNNCGRTMSEEEFIVVDHVYDPLVRKRSRLLNPLVFKLRQEQVLQLYGLTFIHMVNSEAKEEVLNKNIENFTGCDTVSSKPTCGLSYIKDKVIPFSEGFCCSCDSYVNMKRQPSNRAKEISNIGFSAGQLGVPIKESGVRSARSLEEEQMEDNTGFNSKEFLAKGLWGDLFDGGFQEAKPYRVPRSDNVTDNKEERPINEQISNKNINNVTEMKEPIYNDIFDNILPENDSGMENKVEYDSNIYGISDMHEDASNNGTNNQYNSISDFESDTPDILSFGQEPSGSMGKELYKPWLLRNDNTFDTFIKRLKVKDKKPTNTSCSILEMPVVMNMKNYGNPPLEIARGFVKSDYKSNRKVPCPWDIPYLNEQVQPVGNKKYKNDCHKYMHILSKLIQQGIDLENDLNLVPEDILERCKEPEKGTQFIKTIIDKAERKLKIRNAIRDISPLNYNREYNHYRCRRDRHNYDRIMEFNRIINGDIPVLANNEIEEVDNTTGPEFMFDIVWDDFKNVSVGDNNSFIFNNSFNNLKQKLKENVSVIKDDKSNDENDNIDIIWVKSLDYDGNTSESFVNNGQNGRKDYCFNEEKQDINYKDRSFVENEIGDNYTKTTSSGINFTIFRDDAPIIDFLDSNFNDSLITNITYDLNPELMKDSLGDLLSNNKINELSKLVETENSLPEILESKNFCHSTKDYLTDINEDKLNPKQSEFYEKDLLSELIEGKDIYLNGGASINNECTSCKLQLENNKSKNVVRHDHFQGKQFQNTTSKIIVKSNCSGRELIQNFSIDSATEKPEIISLNKSNNNNTEHFMAPHTLMYYGPRCTKLLKVTENSVTISNDFDALNNRLNRVQYNSTTEMLKDSSSINDTGRQATDDFTEFDVVIDKLSDVLNNLEIVKNYSSQLMGDENLTSIERPTQIHQVSNLCRSNSSQNKNFTIINTTVRLLQNSFSGNDNQVFCSINDLYNEINASNKSKDNQNIKTEFISNFSGYGIKNNDSYPLINGKQSFLKSQQMEDLNKLTCNYSDKFNHYNIGELISDLCHHVNPKQILSNLNNSNGAEDQNHLLYDNYKNIKNFLNSQPSIKPSYSTQNQHYYSEKIDYKNWRTDNFQKIELPVVDSKYFGWKVKEDSISGKENESLFKFNPVEGNKYINEQESWSSSLVKPRLKKFDVRNSFVIENDKQKQSFKDTYLKSGEEDKSKNNLSMGNNYSTNIINEGNTKTEKNYFGTQQMDKALNESQLMSVILPSNLTNEKGLSIKLIFKYDDNNSSLVRSKNEVNNSVKKLIKRNASEVNNAKENLSEFAGKTNVSLLDSKLKNASNIIENRTDSFHYHSNSTVHSSALKMNNTQNETSVKFPAEPEKVDELNSVKDKSNKKSKASKKSKTKANKKVKRQILPSGVQYRGGQSCIDRSFPPYANPVTYHESAHCLRFSDLWYNVYRLKRPFIEHSVHMQLYEKHNYPDGRTHWHEVTKGMTVNIGTFVRHTHDALPTLAFTYIPFTDQSAGIFCLDPAKTTLLIPQPLPPEKASDYPQAEGGPNQYMIVRDNEISFDGEECDKAGVSFEAFARQPDRCAKQRGTCLRNQPVDMWRADMEAKHSNRPGKYFLENYASVPRNPFKLNKSRHEEYLALDYMGQFTSAIEVEVRSDLNAIVRTGASGQITEVYVDATPEFHTRITVIATNLGLASSSYFPRLTSCPVGVPEVWTRVEGPLTNISPQHRYIFTMSLYGSLPIDRFHCSMELLNEKQELVATRRIRVQRHDRCICQWHCLCACTGSVRGLSCEPMSLEHYHASGFQGSLPVVTSASNPDGSWTWHVYNILVIYVSTLVNILLLGLIKAILGLCCCSAVGSWGLWLMFPNKAKSLENYKEPNITNYNVSRDCAGYAIHPIHRTRNVRILSKTGEFCINFLFFAAAPLAIIIKLIRICCPCLDAGLRRKTEKLSELGKEDEDDNLSEESKREKSIKAKKLQIMGRELSETESWSLPSDLEFDDDDDTLYVMQERDASQKNLQESFQRSRGGADSIDDNLTCFYDLIKESSQDDCGKVHRENLSDDYGKVHRENLSELEKEMADHLADTLQDACVVYRNFKSPMGGVSLHQGFPYSLKGHFTKIDNSYNFSPNQPVLQYWAADNTPIIPPLTLDVDVFEVTYLTAEDVLLANELSLLPRGLVVNVWHSLDDGTTKPV